MYGEETAERQYSEYSKKKFTQREPEYDQDTDRHRRKSTQVRWGGRDGRREPDSGLGYTQDCHSQWWMADKECGIEGRLTGDRIPEIAGMCRNSQRDFPRRQALFTSDGTYHIVRKRHHRRLRRSTSGGIVCSRTKDRRKTG